MFLATAGRRLGHRAPGIRRTDEIVALVNQATRQIGTSEAPAIAQALPGDRSWTRQEQVPAALDILARSFGHRRVVRADALSTTQVAKLLGTSRQTPHDRVASGSLLAGCDRGRLWFPRWQFDADGPDGVIAGLPQVLRALNMSPLAKIGWLTRANDTLDGQTLLACLLSGETARIVARARTVDDN